MNNSFRNLAVAALLMVATQVLAAQDLTLPGADEPEFVAAVDRWLDDNDEKSLPVLATLAAEGNVAARLLLSRIEITDRASGDFVRSLSRSGRLELFRSKSGSGVFRSSWIKVETLRGNPMAGVLSDGTALGVNIAAIRQLYDIGEIEATEYLVRKVAYDGSQTERRALARLLPPKSELAPYLRGFRFSRVGLSTGRAALQHIIGINESIDSEKVELDSDPDTGKAMKFVGIGYQAGSQAIDYGRPNKYFDAISKWTMTAPASMPVANLCRHACTEQDVSACANTGFGLLGGYYEIIRFDSPLETIIPQSRYINSKRALGMALRKIATARTEAGVRVFSNAQLREKSNCLADAVAALK